MLCHQSCSSSPAHHRPPALPSVPEPPRLQSTDVVAVGELLHGLGRTSSVRPRRGASRSSPVPRWCVYTFPSTRGEGSSLRIETVISAIPCSRTDESIEINFELPNSCEVNGHGLAQYWQWFCNVHASLKIPLRKLE